MAEVDSKEEISNGLEIAIDLSELMSAFAIIRPSITGQNATIALSGRGLSFVSSKDSLASETDVPFECKTGTRPTEWLTFQTQVSLFDRFLCNSRMWRTVRNNPGSKVIFRFPSTALELIPGDASAAIKVDIRCGNLEIDWIFLRKASDCLIREKVVEKCSHLRELAQAFSIASDMADKNGDDRFKVVESRNQTVLSGSPEGARQVSGDGVPDVVIRADQKNVASFCHLLKHMDPLSTMIWRAGDFQHFADKRVHCKLNQLITGFPSIDEIFASEPDVKFAVEPRPLSEAVRRIVAQAADDQSSIGLLVRLGAKPILQFETRVRGGTATVTLDISDPTLPADEREYRASVLVPPLMRTYPALNLSKHSTHLALFAQGIALTVELEQFVVKSLLTFVEPLNIGDDLDRIGSKRDKTVRPKWQLGASLHSPEKLQDS